MGPMVHQFPLDRGSRKRDRNGSNFLYKSPLTDPLVIGPPIGVTNSVPAGIGEPRHAALLSKSTRSMFEKYQPWVLQTYGDQAKTKTITRHKYQRILHILRGDYLDSESSKFKLWVKGRGFRMGTPPGYFHPALVGSGVCPPLDLISDKEVPDIFVQTGTVKDVEGNDRVCFKKVAVVEDFFDIVYNLHVCREGKEEKHMGQKRTYRAVSERYAFVPREAVTKFLVLCTECPRRSSGAPMSVRNSNKNTKTNNNNNNCNNSSNKNSKLSNLSTLTPTKLDSDLSAFHVSPMRCSLATSPILRTSLSVNKGHHKTPSKTKNNFSSVVSLAGKDEEEEDSRDHFRYRPVEPLPPPFNPLVSLQNSIVDHKLGMDTLTLSSLLYPPILQPLPITASSNIPSTPPLLLAPQRTSPPKLFKSEPHSGKHTPEYPPRLKQDATKPRVPTLKIETRDERVDLRVSESNAAVQNRPTLKREREVEDSSDELDEDDKQKISLLSSEVQYSLPITTLYMKQMQSRRKRPKSHVEENNNIIKGSPVTADSDDSDDDIKNSTDLKIAIDSPPIKKEWSPNQREKDAELSSGHLPKNDRHVKSPSSSPSIGPDGGDGGGVCGEPPEELARDDDDDDNDDDQDDDKIDPHYDPERLKAFNMFVRLFVDENLDRIVPISKQPKEKIQAIMDACARQFPEFADRTRKRIRTYLKSCRRNKRARDSNGWENARPTPPHLTSIQAEQILATACDNEAQNAKRMRLGLDPLSQSHPVTCQSSISQTQACDKILPSMDACVGKMDSAVSSSVAHNSSLVKSLERPVSGADSSSPYAAALGLPFGPGFSKASSLPGGHQQVPLLLAGSNARNSASPVLSSSNSHQVVSNGPTDLSLKGGVTKPPSTTPRPSLTPIEVAAVRQLITGYRESAAFLIRSADELENLLAHQQSP